jgi:hypothetical protein
VEPEYLFLTHNFVLNKLKAFSPPCQVNVQLEVDGTTLPTVYAGHILDSSAQGYYSFTAPPRDLLLDKDIFGLRLKSSECGLMCRCHPIPPPLLVIEASKGPHQTPNPTQK